MVGGNCLGEEVTVWEQLFLLRVVWVGRGWGGVVVNVREQCPRWGLPVKKLSRGQFPGWLFVWGTIIQRETVLDFKSILRESLKTRQREEANSGI